MNNASIIEQVLTDDVQKDTSMLFRKRAQELTDIIEALQNIGNSSYWKVLEKYIFDVELVKSKRRLEVESDTSEIFRLQGEVRLGRRYLLDKLLTKYRDELQAIKQKI